MIAAPCGLLDVLGVKGKPRHPYDRRALRARDLSAGAGIITPPYERGCGCSRWSRISGGNQK